MDNLFKIIGIVFGILFLVSAGLQYNDPDPWVWIAIWGISGIIALGYAFRRIAFPIPLIGGIVALIGFFLTYPAKFEGFTIGEGDIKNIEEGREAFGLLIIAVVLLSLALSGWRSGKSKV